MIAYYEYEAHQLAVLQQQYAADQPTLVFLHDALGCINTWRDFPDLLCQRTNCNLLIYDRLGHGQSSKHPDILHRPPTYMEQEAEVLIQLLQDFQIEHPILVGHSDGGTIGLYTAAKAKNAVLGLISIAGHIYVEAVTISGIRGVQKVYLAGEMHKKLEKYHGDKAGDVFQAWTNTWLSPTFQEWNISAYLREINAQTLIIQGMEDEFATIEQAKHIVDGIGNNATLMLLPEVGHFPHKERPNEMLDQMTAFIKNLKNNRII